MTTDSRISQLISRWESLTGQGQTVTIEQLCSDCPELADELRKHVEHVGKSPDAIGETITEQVTVGSTPSAEAEHPTARTGAQFPHVPGYEFVGELGRGGMGVVYKARQTNLNRLVAVKTILSGAHAGTRDRARFYAEAEAVAKLQHANIVQIFDIGECDGAPYFSMEFVEGPSLHRRLQGQPADATTAALLVETIALAIDYAHQRGIVHRDLKPANILMAGCDEASLRECTPKLTDFGLARQLEEDVRLTQTGVVLGTPCYMAPEQVECPAAEIKPTVDVYGLGALLYELLTGRPPFSAATNFETMRQVVSEPPANPSLLVPSVPRALERICLKCLEKHPLDRYQSARAMADELAQFLDDAERAITSPERPSGVRRNNWRFASRPDHRPGTRRSWPRWERVALALLSLLLAVLGIAAFVHWRSERPRVSDAVAAPPIAALLPIRVGILHSSTGTMAISESGVIDATQLAIDELNEEGGLLGRKIEAIVRDGGSDPYTFRIKAQSLLEDEHVSAVFGCWTSASRKMVLPIIEANDSLLVYPVEYEGLELSPNVLYVGATPNQQIIPAVKWCCGFLDSRRFFLIGSDYVFPRVANAIIKDELAARGDVQVVGEAYVPLGGTEIADIVRQIRESKPDVIFNTINGDSNVAFFRALRGAGIRPEEVPVVSFSIGEQELRSMKLEDVVGDYAVRNYFQSIDRPENAQFLNRFWEKYGAQRVVSDAMESGYVGMHLWAKAVTAAGTDDAAKVRAALFGLEYTGPDGPVLVDQEMLNTRRVTRFGRVRADGQFDVIGSSEVPVPPEVYPQTRTREEWDAYLQSLYGKWGGRWSGPTNE